MSTKSTISVQFEDGSVAETYCHFDGYLTGVGMTLLKHWNDFTRAADLILNWGEIRSLKETLEASEFYCRDRGEDFTAPAFYETLQEWDKNRPRGYYTYIMIGAPEDKAKWCTYHGGEFSSLEYILGLNPENGDNSR